MIELKDVSALDFVRSYKDRLGTQELLLRRNVATYQDLKEFIEEMGDYVPFDIKARLESVERDLVFYNRKGKEAEIYKTLGYPEGELYIADKETLVSSLMLWSPTSSRYLNYLSLHNKSIEEVKYLLAHTRSNGDNCLLSYRGVGRDNIGKIVEAISGYEEQVIRQSHETDKRDINLFSYNRDEKREIVRQELVQIILYLLDNTSEEFIWGKASDAQKRILRSCVIDSVEKAQIVRSHLEDMIVDYTTLSELENGITKSKVLNRFIKR